MGALHAGHAALIRRATELAHPVVVSVFVNPTQFGPNEDFARYPRTLEQDLALAAGAGADVVFAPEVNTVYPMDSPTPAPPLPPAATRPGLEDAQRPGHFAGVCQVVARLFDLVPCQAAIFGEKDWQQLQVIRQMVEGMAATSAARWPGLRIVSHPTVREADGLALSSRNRYLRPEQREQALGLSRALDAAQSARLPQDAERVMREVLVRHGLQIDYAVVRDAESLDPITCFDRPARALIAARLDTVRLIDNAAMESAAARRS